MNVTVNITKHFKIAAKPLLKKYPSLSNDLYLLEKQLLNNPVLGTSLGNNAYKIRLKITSKGKGKSGGARIITFVDTIIIKNHTSEQTATVSLLTIYDKSDIASITDIELKELVKKFAH